MQNNPGIPRHTLEPEVAGMNAKMAYDTLNVPNAVDAGTEMNAKMASDSVNEPNALDIDVPGGSPCGLGQVGRHKGGQQYYSECSSIDSSITKFPAVSLISDIEPCECPGGPGCVYSKSPAVSWIFGYP